MITIKHNHEDGTLVYGTVKGDGVLDIVKKWENGRFAYFPSMARQGLPCIGIRSSRDQVADRYRINQAAEALRAAGFDVTVEIDDEFRDRAQVLEDKADRLEDRRDALERKVERHAGAAASAHERASQLSERFAGGQPILVGHHSEPGARRDREKMHAAMRKSVDEDKAAHEVARRASAVGSQMRRSATPAVTARRIKTAEAELRKIQKALDGHERRHLDHAGEPYYIEVHKPATGDYRERLLARKAQLENQLQYDRAQLDAAVEAGQYVEWGKHNVHVGDVVRYWGLQPRTVVKVNKVTVSVESGYSWPDKVKFTEIRAVECPHEDTIFPAAKPKSDSPAPPPPPAPARRTVQAPRLDVAELAAKIETAALEVPRGLETFFSTPMVVERVIEAAEIRPGMTVLEPSAGRGALVKAAALAGALAVHCVELYAPFAPDLLDMDAVADVTSGDFLQVEPDNYPYRFDRVVMNPPFSKGQDIRHVTHALRFLKPGGRLVAVMSNGVAHHVANVAKEFRELVEARGGSITQLPDDAFASAGTNVSTVLVVIPAEE
ncbi:Methyltransferase small domain-containing protein [Nonomuraea maritima]|uniref:Methyltransferase small domain-containing protein n=1 Tax=Nonomuraea maritima TaxID=683260 RepID=A0A1G9MNZ4_9ACTN|nr:DUF3560 domain-containing protein [Nonomuraea maritima]SDL75803.1 Methyltransferase small domain-containing protein [Nonomuraea maritima]